MNTFIALTTAASAPASTPTQNSSSGWLTPVIIVIIAVCLVGLIVFFLTTATTTVIDGVFGGVVILTFVGAIALSIALAVHVVTMKSSDSPEEPTVATEPATPTPAPVEGEPTIDNRDQQVSELGDTLTERFGVDVDGVVLSQAVTLVSESGDAQQVMGVNKEGKQVVVTVFSTVDSDENTLSVAVSAG